MPYPARLPAAPLKRALRRERHMRGETWEQLATRLGISSRTLTRLLASRDIAEQVGDRMACRLGLHRIARFRDAPSLLLFVFHSERREAEARRHLRNAGMCVATVTMSALMSDPLGRTWLRVRGERRTSIVDLLFGDGHE